MNKKIVILYASVGGGHFKAAEAVKNYILENKPNCKVEMLDALKYTNKAIDKIIISSYVNMARYSPKVWGDIYKLSAKQYSVANFSNAVQKLLSLKLVKYLNEQNPDAVISTHPFITEMCAILKKKKQLNAKLNVIITDYASHRFWELKPEFIDNYFVANEQIKYSMVYNGISEEKIHVTGIPVSPAFLKSYNKDEIYEEFGLDSQKRTILIFGGGEYGLSNIKTFFNGLLELRENVQIIMVAGKRKKSQKMFSELAENSSKKVIVLGYTNKVPELMNIADLVISKPGGLTTTEIITTGVPFAVINPIPGQEEENAEFLLNSGAGVRIFDAKKTKPFLDQLLSDSIRLQNIVEMQKHVSKPNSTKNIVDVIFENL